MYLQGFIAFANPILPAFAAQLPPNARRGPPLYDHAKGVVNDCGRVSLHTEGNPLDLSQCRAALSADVIVLTISMVTVMGVCRGKAALSSGCKTHPATAPAGSNR